MVYPALLVMYKVSVQFTPKKLRRLYSAEINYLELNELDGPGE